LGFIKVNHLLGVVFLAELQFCALAQDGDQHATQHHLHLRLGHLGYYVWGLRLRFQGVGLRA